MRRAISLSLDFPHSSSLRRDHGAPLVVVGAAETMSVVGADTEQDCRREGGAAGATVVIVVGSAEAGWAMRPRCQHGLGGGRIGFRLFTAARGCDVVLIQAGNAFQPGGWRRSHRDSISTVKSITVSATDVVASDWRPV